MGRDAGGRVVFVPYAIAGEEVRAEITEEKKGYARARLVEVLRPSPDRITPRCPHFGPPPSVLPLPQGAEQWVRGCGGCQWQHIGYAAQLRFKTEIVREQFARIGKIPEAPVQSALGMETPWDYRNNVQFQVDSEGRLCFRALESHNLVPIRECHILDPRVSELFHSIESAPEFEAVELRAGTRTGQKMVILEGRDATPPEVSVDEPVSIVYATPEGEMFSLIGRDALHEELGGRTFRVSPGSFFQVNTAMAEILVDRVTRYLTPAAGETLLDAFGGVGTFGLLLAGRVAKVVEIEESREAVQDAHANAVDLSNVEFHAGRVEQVLPQLTAPIHLAVMDPPRAGVDRAALEALIARGPRALVYVSCDPATLARDARRLVDAGYRLVEVQPVDLFPQTFHIESVTLFTR